MLATRASCSGTADINGSVTNKRVFPKRLGRSVRRTPLQNWRSIKMASGQRGKDVDEGLSTLDAVSSRYRENWGLWRDCRGHPPSAAQLASCCASSMTVEAIIRKSPLSV